MSDRLTAVKVEIKHWEHTFKAENGHEPTRDDIKANPVIAEKYKLYNKLKKEFQEQQQPNNNHVSRHRTPSPRPAHARPHHHSTTAAIPSKVPPTASSAVLDTKNPFSPHKKKQTLPNTEPERVVWNPFMTPVKSARVRVSTPSPSPEPIVPHQVAKRPNSIISKARKRLRGDSVSPSPPQRQAQPSGSGLLHLSKEEENRHFIEESPVKPTTNGKSFQPLFHDISSQPSTSTVPERKTFKKAKTVSGSLFGTTRDTRNDGFFASQVIDASSQTKGKIPDRDGAMHNSKKRKTLPGPKGLIPSKDNLFDESLIDITTQPSSSRKRTISKVTQENTDKPSQPKESNEWNLLPPSPIAEEKKPWNNANSRKKRQKLAEKVQQTDGKDDDDDDDESDAESDNVNIIDWHEAGPVSQTDGDSGWEVDPELHSQLRLGGLSNRPVESQSPEPETFDVDLPEEMQEMLSLSPTKESQNEDEVLAKSVIQGRRQGGAEVWGPGEFGGESEGSEGVNHDVDEWEGEGVPWEVGEL